MTEHAAEEHSPDEAAVEDVARTVVGDAVQRYRGVAMATVALLLVVVFLPSRSPAVVLFDSGAVFQGTPITSPPPLTPAVPFDTAPTTTTTTMTTTTTTTTQPVTTTTSTTTTTRPVTTTTTTTTTTQPPPTTTTTTTTPPGPTCTLIGVGCE